MKKVKEKIIWLNTLNNMIDLKSKKNWLKVVLIHKTDAQYFWQKEIVIFLINK